MTRRERDRLISRRRAIFDYYDRLSEAGELLSFYDMALSSPTHPERAMTERDILCLCREPSQRLKSEVVDIGNLVDPSLLSYYRARIDYVKRTQRNVDQVLDQLVAILLMSWKCRSECSGVKLQLAQALNRNDIAEKSNVHVLRALMCILLNDVSWKYFYYLPCTTPGVEVPTSAMALAASRSLSASEIQQIDMELHQKTFDCIYQAEARLAGVASKSMKELTESIESIPRGSAEGAGAIVSRHGRRLYRATDSRFVEVGGEASLVVAASERDLVRGFIAGIPLECDTGHGGYFLFSRMDERFSHRELQRLSKFGRQLSRIVYRYDPTIPLPRCWLAVDIANSSQRFEDSPYVTWIVLREFNEWAARILYANGADRIGSTPDGFMAGFWKLAEGLNAAESLINDLEELTETVDYKAGSQGMAIKLGLCNSKEKPLGRGEDEVPQIVGKALNVAGHLQKYGEKTNVLYIDKDTFDQLSEYGRGRFRGEERIVEKDLTARYGLGQIE